MWIDGFPPESNWITEAQRPQWRADIAALRDLRLAEEQHPLHQGDLFNELKQRWGLKMPALAQEAGVPYHAARQRARVAEAIPPGSPLRATGLSYSILRLLAPLADPEPWAQQALALQEAGQLRVRPFARLLEQAGVRRPRAPRPLPTCLHCGQPVADETTSFHVHSRETTGWICTPHCGMAYFSVGQPRTAPVPAPLRSGSAADRGRGAIAREPESQSPSPADLEREHESQSLPDVAAATPASQSPPTSAPTSDPDTQIIRLRGRFIGMWKRRPP